MVNIVITLHSTKNNFVSTPMFNVELPQGTYFGTKTQKGAACSSNFHSCAPPWLRLSVFCPTVHPLQTTDHKSEGSMWYSSTSFGTAEACTKNTKQIYTSQREKQNLISFSVRPEE